MWKQYRSIVLIVLIFASHITFAQNQKPTSSSRIYNCYPKNCGNLPNPVRQPNGPFAVFVFCEDAVGTYIAVSCYDVEVCEQSTYPDGSVRFEGWKLYDRFWQEKDWATDVTSFAWSPDGKYLYVATSYIYGTPALYKLDLEARRSTELLKNDAPASVFITGIDPKGQYLYYRLGDNNKILILP